MKRSLAVLVLFVLFLSQNVASALSSPGDSMKSNIVSGIYNEKNLYFYTPSCKISSDRDKVVAKFKNKIVFESSQPKSFQVDLSKKGLVYGDIIELQLFYMGCKPFLVNEESIEKRNSFKISDLQVSDSGKVSFKTFNEIDKFPFIIQQYKWSKWVSVAKVRGEGGDSWKAYRVKSMITSGVNKFRVVRYNLWKPPTMSEEYIFTSLKESIDFNYDRNIKKVIFSDITSYEVKNEYGENVLTGLGDKIDMSELGKGLYFIAFDNSYVDITL